MNIGYNWLKDYIKIPFSPEELADRLTMLGLEVATITDYKAGLDLCRICLIKTISPHPNADRLSICEVDSGDRDISIVCGAKNMKPGDKVPLALSGACLPKIGEVKDTKIRDVPSKGMLCSAWELGLGQDRSGLMILPDDAPVGKDLAAYLNLADTIFEIDLTPNRADCLSHLGIAREIAAITGEKASLPEIEFPEDGDPIQDLINIQILDQDLCRRYVGRVITGVTIGPSPPWLVSRLASVGIRSINNIVDVTNYVLMETGQPLHAFDYDLLQGQKILVRTANQGERFKTLDDTEREVDNSVLMIADANHSIAIAGVMGGLDTEVTDVTKNILIESALFSPNSIRRTSKKLGLSTEASQRFERGIDPDGVLLSAERATQLILQLAGGKAAKGAMDAYPRPVEKKPVRLRIKRANRFLGIALPSQKITDILKGLSFESISGSGEDLAFMPPSFRQDIFQEVDLIEEIARVYGYDNIPTTIPSGEITMGGKTSKNQNLASITRDILTGAGLDEVINFSFTKKGLFDNIKFEGSKNRHEFVNITNPLTEEQDALRHTLIPDLIQNLVYNIARQNRDVKIFELSTCFFPSQEEETKTKERQRLGIALMGQREERHWRVPARDIDFFDLKGLIEALFQKVGIKGYQFSAVDSDWLEKGVSFQVLYNKREMGIMGELSSKIMPLFDLKKTALVAELDFDLFADIARPYQHRFRAIPKFPPVLRDLAVIVDKGIAYQKVIDLIYQEGGELLKEATLFDIYVGEQIPEGKKSLAFSLKYRSEERTLTDKEVDKVHQDIFNRLGNELKAVMR